VSRGLGLSPRRQRRRRLRRPLRRLLLGLTPLIDLKGNMRQRARTDEVSFQDLVEQDVTVNTSQPDVLQAFLTGGETAFTPGPCEKWSFSRQNQRQLASQASSRVTWGAAEAP
jgi:hypothetical protein